MHIPKKREKNTTEEGGKRKRELPEKKSHPPGTKLA